ncbi:MarR family winged helix-turn-helix transcriptional regulator [Runella sp.]|uniref:MarR family winged helix-turn-helix transcriptional regulator n=1 Tax=Runella sp. TaxID=1960881 RepID=UPI003D13F3BB
MSNELDTDMIQTISDLGRRFSDATIMMHEAIAGKAGLSGTDHKYLGILIRNGAMTAGELSKLTGLTTGAITGVIDRLEKKNLAKREFDEDDRRKIIIVPNTENATLLLGPAFADLQHKMVGLISTLSAHEREIVEKYLLSTIAVMNEVTAELNNKPL